jgi:NAD(P)-dependent dehydrogenase (short-subunit alcohol dehydrogenase family)
VNAADPPPTQAYVVTGAGRGIGRATAERLIESGARVVILERDVEAVAWVDEHPRRERIACVAGDAADEATATRAAELASPLRGWVNNAALIRGLSLHHADTTSALELIRANLDATVIGCAVAIRRFLADGTLGSIVNVSSLQARQAVPGFASYVTAKAAVEGLTRALAVEYAAHGIRVNAVAPGTIGTDALDAWLAEHDPATATRLRDELAAVHPLGRIGRPAEVADAITYLLSDRATFITGATLAVDGGRSVVRRDP